MLYKLHKTPLAVEAKKKKKKNIYIYIGVNSGRVGSDCHAKIYKTSIHVFADNGPL
jgi:hypothetical protein